MTKRRLFLKALFFIVIGGLANLAWSYTECEVKTDRLFVGDDGYLWMIFEGGGNAYINISDVDFDNTYSLLLAAQLADKGVVVRYQASGVQCNVGTRSDITGVWLKK